MPLALVRLVRGHLGVAAVSIAALAGCAADPGPPERQTIPAPESEVDQVSADPSFAVHSQDPDVIVAHDITTASSITVVVTKRRPLDPVSYAPPDLVSLSGVAGGGSHQMRAEAAGEMTRMYEDAAAADVPFRISTAYRAYGFQQHLYSRDVQRLGAVEADRRVARPGYSEHQTGLTADI